jgi:hypothetical protein
MEEDGTRQALAEAHRAAREPPPRFSETPASPSRCRTASIPRSPVDGQADLPGRSRIFRKILAKTQTRGRAVAPTVNHQRNRAAAHGHHCHLHNHDDHSSTMIID